MESPPQSSAHLRNLKIAIEFKYLMKHAPGGVFIMPEFDSIKTFHGVIFVRRGTYRDGIFRFILKLPEEYSSPGTHPQITFQSKWRVNSSIWKKETKNFDAFATYAFISCSIITSFTVFGVSG